MQDQDTLSGPVAQLREEPAPLARLYAALAKAQGSFTDVVRDHMATVPGKDGKQGYTYRYATLDNLLKAVRGPLSANGLALYQYITYSAKAVSVQTVLAHEHGATLEPPVLTWPTEDYRIQSLGSTITYLRRYALTALLGLAPTDEDDDGSVSEPARKNSASTAKPVDRGPSRTTAQARPATREVAPATREVAPSPAAQAESLAAELDKGPVEAGEWVDPATGEFLAADEGFVPTAVKQNEARTQFHIFKGDKLYTTPDIEFAKVAKRAMELKTPVILEWMPDQGGKAQGVTAIRMAVRR